MDSFEQKLFTEGIQKNLPLLSQMLEDQVQPFIAIRPGLSVIAGAVGNKLIQLYVL